MTTEAVAAFGRNVRTIREAQGLSGSALAKRAGISQGHLWDLEAGRTRDPAVSVAQALAHALGVTVDELLQDPAHDGPGPAEGGTGGVKEPGRR